MGGQTVAAGGIDKLVYRVRKMFDELLRMGQYECLTSSSREQGVKTRQDDASSQW